MSRLLKLSSWCVAVGALSVAVAACGTQGISVHRANGQSTQAQIYHGAVLFSERCAGCHTLSYAGARGSAANVRTAQFNNGPNFNVRCERPLARILYAVANGGFSGAVMPQNIVVGSDAIDVARFVATYSGRQAPKVPGVVPCQRESVGTVPTAGQLAKASQTASGATQESAAAGSKKARGKTPGGPAGKTSLPSGQGGNAPSTTSPTP